MKAQKTLAISLFLAFGIPLVYALVMRYLFGSMDDVFEIMSISFLFLLPILVGFLCVFLSRFKNSEKWWFIFFAPWIPVVLFAIITLILSIEGFACWVMVMPLFLLAASLGGIIAGYLKRREIRSKAKISLLVLLPFLISPLEDSINTFPSSYKAYTYIDINSTPELIWDEVTRVKAIPNEEDRGDFTKFLGFPRPIEALLDYEGIGASREAKFSGGLVFHEKVVEYQDNKKMVFTIAANTHEIPAATMDEHVLIGGDYFDVLKGTYELEKIDSEKYRLHLFSNFELNTSFNFYAAPWAKWIMKDIQNNILQVEKKRAESNFIK